MVDYGLYEVFEILEGEKRELRDEVDVIFFFRKCLVL